jgi:hypothetical protein
MSESLYERDFHAWATEQAALLRAGKLSEADIANIAEEIDSIGRAERNELTNRLAVLLAHLLKWQFQPERRGRGWLLSIRGQRLQVRRTIRQNPGLRPQIAEIMADAYEAASISAQRETDLPEEVFPTQSTWTFDQAMHGEPVPDQGA